MAYYAFIGYENKVVKVITGVDETITQLDGDVEVGGSTEAWEQFYQNQPWHEGLICKRTSYNGNIRKQYGHIGYTYDAERDAFIAPEPANAIGFDETTCRWITPEPEPEPEL